MSPAASFRVELWIGRVLARDITASSAEVACEIAERLYEINGDRDFTHDGEDIVDVIATPLEQEDRR